MKKLSGLIGSLLLLGLFAAGSQAQTIVSRYGIKVSPADSLWGAGKTRLDSLYIGNWTTLITATAANLNTLTDDSMADALHRHSELSGATDGTPNPALTVTTAGLVVIDPDGTPPAADSTLTIVGGASTTGGAKIGGTLNIGSSLSLGGATYVINSSATIANANANILRVTNTLAGGNGQDDAFYIFPTASVDNNSSMSSIRLGATVSSGKTLAYRYGIYVADASVAGTLTNNYGIYIADHAAGGTDYGIYSAGGNNYFNGLTFAADILPATDNGPNIGSVAATVDTVFTRGLNVGAAANDSTVTVAGGLSTTGGAKITGRLTAGSYNEISAYGAENALNLYDTRALAAGTGGAVRFWGYYTGTTATAWATIAGLKETATDGEYGAYLSFQTRAHLGSTIEKWRISSTGHLLPAADNTYKIGSVAATPDTIFAKVALVVGDIPYLDLRNDVEDIRKIKPMVDVDSLGGIPLVDDNTLPKYIMLTHAADAPARLDTLWTETQVKEDSTLVKYEVPVDSLGAVTEASPVYEYAYRTEREVDKVTPIPAHVKGDLVLKANGKPFYNPTALDGLLLGAIKQLATTDDSLRTRIATLEERLAALEARVSKVEAR